MSFRSKITAVAAACAVGLLASPAVAAAAPGAPGAGDAYYPGYGNGGYDVWHYDIRLNYLPATDRLAGSTTVLAKATQDLSRFNLDFALAVQSVRVNGLAAGFAQSGTELVVTPAREVLSGADLTVVVTYSDTPSTVKPNGFSPWTRTPDGALAVGDPEMAAWWFPSNDHPSDKATFDVSVAAPDGVEVISNGLFQGTSRQINGTTRWNWRSTKPQATYLAFLAIGQFEVRQSTTPGGTPVVNAYSLDLGANEGAAKASVERTPEYVQFLEGYLGPYPMEAQGGVVSPYVMGALETQTRPSYGGARFARGSNPYLVAHELSHQWLGDSVTVQRWKDVWLNEGFATYLEWLLSEQLGEGTVQENATWTHGVYPPDHSVWNTVVADPGPGDKLFDAAIYERGALALHALRLEVGDPTFFSILRTWVERKQYGNATTEEFIALAEELSGRQLDEVFQQWIFSTGKPASAPGGSVTSLTVPTEPKSFRQIQENHHTKG
jgi:aminopeptidase N